MPSQSASQLREEVTIDGGRPSSESDMERGVCCTTTDEDPASAREGYFQRSLDSDHLVGPLLVQAFATG